MILLLDTEKQEINLYNKSGLMQIPFQKASELYDLLENDKVIYVTNAVETTSTEVINLIKQSGVVVETAPVPSGVTYLHATEEGTIYINEFLKFEGLYDVKVIDENMQAMIEQYPLVKHLISNKKIEIINSVQRMRLLKQFDEMEDKKVGSIIVEDSVDDFVKGKSSKGEHSDAIVVDLNAGGSAVEGGRVNTMSELLEEMEGLE
jgi:hypothetical protein